MGGKEGSGRWSNYGPRGDTNWISGDMNMPARPESIVPAWLVYGVIILFALGFVAFVAMVSYAVNQ